MLAGRHQSGDMGNISHQKAPTLSAICGTARSRACGNRRCSPQTIIFGLCSIGQPLHLVVIEQFGLTVHAIGEGLVERARETDTRAMGQMAAVGKRHAEDRIAGLEHAEVDGHVGLTNLNAAAR